jgi:hypothetical protein
MYLPLRDQKQMAPYDDNRGHVRDIEKVMNTFNGHEVVQRLNRTSNGWYQTYPYFSKQKATSLQNSEDREPNMEGTFACHSFWACDQEL